jgi:predicted ATPase
LITQLEFINFGPIDSIKSEKLSNINLFIGINGTGKTFILKALYAMIKSTEEHKRGDDRRSFEEVLSDKLYWTFQTEKLGELVQKGERKKLKASLTLLNNTSLFFEFGPDTTKKITNLRNTIERKEANSIFLPPKEVLTLFNVIIKTGIQDKSFGFDATYTDLVLALQNPPQKDSNYEEFAQTRQKISDIFEGRVEYDSINNRWTYKKQKSKFLINITAEGIKKIAILDTLLGNGFLTKDSIIFIDEPESALHPNAISRFMEIIYQLSKAGIQFFIATHSYFVVKKLYLIAKNENIDLPVFVGDNMIWQQENLKEKIPDNEIIKESIRLFDEEISVGFQ